MEPLVKDSLHQAINQLDEADCRQILAWVQQLQRPDPFFLRHLLADPTFNIPSSGFRSFQSVQPIPGQGIPASSLLVEDRG